MNKINSMSKISFNFNELLDTLPIDNTDNKIIADWQNKPEKHVETIKNKYGDIQCSYTDMHQYNKIVNICNDDMYGFIDEVID